MYTYHKITKEDIDYFASIFPQERLITGESISNDYAKDELGTVTKSPEIMIYPISSIEISKIMTYANQHLIPVVCRGSGTGLVGACVPIYGGIVVNTTKMNHILEMDEKNLTLTVEPGVLLMDIYQYVEERGYFYAPDPGEKTATIGGNISTNAGGMRAIRYGTTREWVRGLEVVLPDGSIEQFGRKVVKDSTGYSLKNLIIGSEGTLGIVTKAILKISPKPVESLSLLVPFSSISDGLKAVPEIINEKLSPIAVEFFEQSTIGFAEKYLGRAFPDKSSEAYILLTFEARTKDELKSVYEQAAELCINNLKAKDVYLVDTDERKESVWKARGAFLEAIKATTPTMDECDVVLPRSRMAEYIQFTYDLASKYQIRIPSFGHAGDGNLHIYICKDQYSSDEFEKRMEKIFNEMYDKADEFGGLVSGEHGIGYAKKKYMKKMLGEKQVELMKGIKSVFDPNHILNPDKVIDA
jgi:glycolate oxidase